MRGRPQDAWRGHGGTCPPIGAVIRDELRRWRCPVRDGVAGVAGSPAPSLTCFRSFDGARKLSDMGRMPWTGSLL